MRVQVAVEGALNSALRALRDGALAGRLVVPDAGRREVRGARLPLRLQSKIAAMQRRGDAVGVQQEPLPGATASTAAMNRRCCSMGSSTRGMPQIAVPTLPCSRAGRASGSSKASPWMTVTPGSTRRRWWAMSGTISTTTSFSAGTPAARSARLMTPVPAPSSTTTSSSACLTSAAIFRQSAGDEGMMEPICSGLASHRRKKRAALATSVWARPPVVVSAMILSLTNL